ncbi:hypothetical protein KJ766_02435, partial [Patescibacteria group bacterium]|nr:hypothetical protein [Patescibacteria group bacterium]
LEDSNPSVQAGEAPEWAFANLTNSEPIEIEFSGIFAADIEGFQYFNVNTGIQENKKTYIQNSTQGFTDLLKTDISLSMVANGAINDAIVGMGDDLRVTLALENQSEVAIDNADLLLDFQSNLPMPIDWSKSNLDGGTVTQDGIYWSNDTLGALAAGEKRILNISFPVNETIPSTKADNFTLTASSSVGSFIIRSSPISVSIATDASFEAIAKYFNDSGSPIGSGPIPPEVGQQTSYRIYWQINNSLHDLDAITVEATLPPNVEWRSGASSDLGSVTFDSTTNTVQWKISNLTSSLTSVGANFLLELTPSSSDINKFAKLLSGSTFKAIDSTTRASIQSTTGSLTTDLEYDPYAEGKGIVIE